MNKEIQENFFNCYDDDFNSCKCKVLCTKNTKPTKSNFGCKYQQNPACNDKNFKNCTACDENFFCTASCNPNAPN